MGLHYYDAEKYPIDGEYEEFLQEVADIGRDHGVSVQKIVFVDC